MILLPLKVLNKILLIVNTFKALREKLDIWRILRWLFLIEGMWKFNILMVLHLSVLFSVYVVYSFRGLLDAYPIADTRPVQYKFIYYMKYTVLKKNNQN